MNMLNTAMIKKLKNSLIEIESDFKAGKVSLYELLKRISFSYDTFFKDSLEKLSLKTPMIFLGTGSFARKELSLKSDVDILIITEKTVDLEAQEIVNAIIYPLWDIKVEVGYSIRKTDEFIEFALNDVMEWTKVLDCKFIYGNKEFFKKFKYSIDKELFNSRVINKNLKELFILNDSRREKAGNLVYNLEPDIKTNPGGLRDLHLVRWYVKLFDKKGDVLRASEVKNIRKANNYYLYLRNVLHCITGRKTDLLGFEQQNIVADTLYPGETGKLEKLMKRFYFYGNLVDYAYEYIRERFFSTFLIDSAYNRKIDEFFYIDNFKLCMYDYNMLRENPHLIIKSFYLSQDRQVYLSYDLREAIKANVRKIDSNYIKNRENVNMFFNILEKGSPLASTLRVMNQLDFLSYFIPEFKKIKYKITYDMYHKYTVDIHSLLAVQELRNLFNGNYILEFPFISALSLNLPDKRYLLFAALLHDIGKGIKGNESHLVKGAVVAERICKRMGLDKKITENIKFIVANHTLMTNTALRRDINNEEEIMNFAKKVNSTQLLNFLFLISFADLKAVSPETLDKWKYSKLQDLYIKTFSIINQKNYKMDTVQEKIAQIKSYILENIPKDEEIKFNKFISILSRRLILNFQPQEILRLYKMSTGVKKLPFIDIYHNKDKDLLEILTLYHNYPGIFNKIVGILSLSNFNIVSGEIYTNLNGTIIDIFEVKPIFQHEFPEELFPVIENNMEKYLNEKSCSNDFEKELNRKILSYRKKNIYNIVPIIKFNNSDNGFFTILEIIAEDFVGLLYKITKILSKRGLEIHSSKITTQGVKAIDTFYITDMDGYKIIDKALQEKLTFEIMETLNEFKNL